MTKDTKPLRGSKYRSRAFQEYLLRQSPERRAEILAGERRFTDLRESPHCLAAAAERDYAQDLLGPESKLPGEPAGSHLATLLGRS
jgi:hypothetical protein